MSHLCRSTNKYVRVSNDGEIYSLIVENLASDDVASVEIPLTLAGKSYNLRFVGTHWFDLKTVFEKTGVDDDLSPTEVVTNVTKFSFGGKNMLDEFPIRLTLREVQALIADLSDYPVIIEKLQQAIRTQEKGSCQIRLSLDLEITKLLANKQSLNQYGWTAFCVRLTSAQNRINGYDQNPEV